MKMSHLWRDLEFVSTRTEKTRTALASFTERKKGTLLFKGKTDSLVQRNATEGEMPVFVPARDHRITRREGDTDGQVIKEITSGESKCMRKNNVENRETL